MYVEIRGLAPDRLTLHGPTVAERDPAEPETTWVALPAERPLGFGRAAPAAPSTPAVQIREVTLSRWHFAVVPLEGGRHGVVDVGSAGGTIVNDGVLRTGAVVPLAPGDRIRLGDGSATYRTDAPRMVRLSLIARRWVALWSTGDPVEFEALHAETFVDRAPGGRPPDRAGLRAGLDALRAAFPDLALAVDDAIVALDRDLVTVRWSGEGTHEGAYLGAAPAGRRIRFRGIEIVAIDPAGRLIERWGEWDGLDLLEQLGQLGQLPG